MLGLESTCVLIQMILNVTGDFDPMLSYAFVSWTSWILNLALAEWGIRSGVLLRPFGYGIKKASP